MSEPCCAICESTEAEGVRLIPIHTPECVVLMCSWPCMYISKTHCWLKCRHCGSVGTIPKWQVPGGMSLGTHTFIIFTEGCKFCGEGDAKN